MILVYFLTYDIFFFQGKRGKDGPGGKSGEKGMVGEKGYAGVPGTDGPKVCHVVLVLAVFIKLLASLVKISNSSDIKMKDSAKDSSKFGV